MMVASSDQSVPPDGKYKNHRGKPTAAKMHFLPALVVLLAIIYSEAKPGHYESYAYQATIPAKPQPKKGIKHKLKSLLGYMKGPGLVSCALRGTPNLRCPVDGDCCPDDSCCPSR